MVDQLYDTISSLYCSRNKGHLKKSTVDLVEDFLTHHGYLTSRQSNTVFSSLTQTILHYYLIMQGI